MKKIIFLIIFAVLLVISVGNVYELVTDYGNRKWDSQNRFTVIVMESSDHKTEILSIDPQSRQAVRMIVPPDMEIPTLDGKGTWNIAAVVTLAKKYGLTWAADSIADYFGIPYTAIREDMGIWDKISWWNLNRGVDFMDVNLASTEMVRDVPTPDGNKRVGLTNWWQNKAGSWFYSSALAKEGLQVEIYNTTNILGLAARAARVLDNSGVKVVMLSQSDQQVDQCIVKTSTKMKDDAGIKWIVRNYKCTWKNDDGMDDQDVKMFVGDAYAKQLYGAQ